MIDGRKEIWKEYENKRVFVELINKRRYTGKVKYVDNQFLVMIDKFGQLVSIKEDNIVTIEEQPIKQTTDGKNGDQV